MGSKWARLTIVALAAEIVSAQTAALQGVVFDANHQPVAAASVALLSGDGRPLSKGATEKDGTYRFASLSPGSYELHADKAGAGVATSGVFSLVDKDVKVIDLRLRRGANQAPQFYDEPQFVVAGVTENAYQGGHGSDVVVRSTDALVRAAASLSQGAPAGTAHAQAEAAEKSGNPVEAARLYQRAAELDASEPNLFAWGAELLIHRAAGPAIQVFSKGYRLFPGSVRILLGLAAAWYARGAYDEAAKYFFAACDLNVSDPTPYLFLGEIRSPVITDSDSYVERLERFARLRPESALADYYYAASLWKRRRGPDDKDTPAKVKALLEQAIHLNPRLGAAYLLLGNVDSSKADYEKAVEVNPDLEEAHYRLSQIYRRSGDLRKAQAELDLYKKLSKKAAEDLQRERRAVPQFAVTLRRLPAK